MRLTCGLAIALWLSFTVAGMACGQQEPAGANSGAQAPAAPAPKESAPAQQAPGATSPPATDNPQTPAAEQKAHESAPNKKTDVSGAGATARTTRKRHKHTVSVSPPDGGPRKVVVREGGAKEPTAQIVPGMSPAEATRQRQTAERLLGSTDERLKQLAGRTLNAHQQETLGQIRNYTDGARTALKEGDVHRANTLAQKAHLLAEDLVKHSGLGEAH